MKAYKDSFGEFYGIERYNGLVGVFVLGGGFATRLDCGIHPVNSEAPCRVYHQMGIVLTPEDATAIGLPVFTR